MKKKSNIIIKKSDGSDNLTPQQASRLLNNAIQKQVAIWPWWKFIGILPDYRKN